MARNFDDFLSAYYEWSRDNYCPDKFHLWTGVSVIAGVLGRKVWANRSAAYIQYPNLYVMFVAGPGMGKTVASSRGVSLMRKTEQVRFMPTQVTVAKFIDLMSAGDSIQIGTKHVPHSSFFYYASEAENSFKDVHEEIIPLFTDFYDCPAHWSRATKKDGEIKLHNICLNVLGCTTYSHMTTFLDRHGIKGGFASRFIYVSFDDVMERNIKWSQVSSDDTETGKKLVEDLNEISKIVGPFDFERSFVDAYEDWANENDREIQSLESDVMRALKTRKGVTLSKLCMICSISERSDKMLTRKHFDRALKYLSDIDDDIASMTRQVQSQNTHTHGGAMQAVLHELAKGPKDVDTIKMRLQLKGFDMGKIQGALTTLTRGKNPVVGMIPPLKVGDDLALKLLRNPDQYL